MFKDLLTQNVCVEQEVQRRDYFLPLPPRLDDFVFLLESTAGEHVADLFIFGLFVAWSRSTSLCDVLRLLLDGPGCGDGPAADDAAAGFDDALALGAASALAFLQNARKNLLHMCICISVTTIMIK